MPPERTWDQTRKIMTTSKDTLEQLVDILGLGNVLDNLSIICAEKAEHVQTTYPGPPVRGGPRKGEPTTSPIAKAWRRRAAIVGTAANRVLHIPVS